MTVAIDLYSGMALDAAEVQGFCGGQVAVFTRPAPGRDGPNEDAALLARIDDTRGVLAVADGMGGRPAGEVASRVVLEKLREVLLAEGARDLRAAILKAIDEANEALIEGGTGAGSTLSLVEIDGRRVRTYHVGDSIILVTGQRGRRKLETVSHSPVGYAVEAGIIGEDEAMQHEERHLVSVVLGDRQTRVSMSAPVTLSRRDTLLIASDGVADNLTLDEVIESIRKGPLDAAAARLEHAARRRMEAPEPGDPSKPDDLTFILYRPSDP